MADIENIYYNNEKKSQWTLPARYNLEYFVDRSKDMCLAKDSKNFHKEVTIHKISKVRLQTKKEDLVKTLREVRILMHVKHSNVIELEDVFMNGQIAGKIGDIYIVTNQFPTDLSNLLKTQKLAEEQIVLLSYQIFRGLKYLHSCNIIHRDIKPHNIFVNENVELQLGEFGMARTQSEFAMTEYVVTRWYRAPELLLRRTNYSTAIDMWSVGCVIAEMFFNKPLFPGQNSFDQMRLILSMVAYPTGSFLENSCPEEKQFFDYQFENKSSRIDFRKYFKICGEHQKRSISDKMIDMLERLLCLNPDDRMTSQEALQHLAMRDYHDEEDEPCGAEFIDPFESEENSSESNLRDKIVQLVGSLNAQKEKASD